MQRYTIIFRIIIILIFFVWQTHRIIHDFTHIKIKTKYHTKESMKYKIIQSLIAVAFVWIFICVFALKFYKWLDSPWECLSGTESTAVCLGRSRVRGCMLVCGCKRVFCKPWRGLLVGFSIASRRHLDRYSLLFRSFFACSSFGPRSVFDRLTNKQRETNERRTKT